MSFNVTWKGSKKLSSALLSAGNKSDIQVNRVVKNNTELTMRKARKLAPRDTNYLADHIKTAYPVKLEGHIIDEAGYAGYQEYGTRYQPGTPHMRPALKYIEPKFKKEIEEVMEGLFDDS